MTNVVRTNVVITSIVLLFDIQDKFVIYHNSLGNRRSCTDKGNRRNLVHSNAKEYSMTKEWNIKSMVEEYGQRYICI